MRDEALIGEWLATHEPTPCPTVYLVPSINGRAPLRSTHVEETPVEMYRRLYVEEQLSVRSIANMAGRCTSTVSRELRKAGIKIRGRSNKTWGW